MKNLVKLLVALVCTISLNLASIVSPNTVQAAGLLGICFDGSSSASPPCSNPNDTFFPLYPVNNGQATLSYKIDPSAVGDINNATAVSDIEDTFSTWEDESTLNFARSGSGLIDVDVTTSNVLDFLAPSSTLGFSPVVLDEDGSITDFLFGTGSKNSILGFAGASFFSVSGSNITGIAESSASFNGFLFTAATQGSLNAARQEFKSTVIHEFGHAVGFDHTQGGFVDKFEDLINGNPVSNLHFVPIMFPFSVNPTCAPPGFDCDLTRDDIAAAGFYPTSSFPTSTGSIRGVVVDGGSPVFGASVAAFNVSDPDNQNVASASDVDGLGNGTFDIPGLPPGDYIIKVEAINELFTGGSSVGIHDPPSNPASIPTSFYNGEGENLVQTDLETALATVARVTVVAGQETGGIIMSLDGSEPPSTPTVQLKGAAFNKLHKLKTSKVKKVKYVVKKLATGQAITVVLSTPVPDLIQFSKPSMLFNNKKKKIKGKVKLAPLSEWVEQFPELLDGDFVDIQVTATDTINNIEVVGIITVFAPLSAILP